MIGGSRSAHKRPDRREPVLAILRPAPGAGTGRWAAAFPSRAILLGALVAVAALAEPAFGLEATGTIKKVNARTGVVVVFANGADRTLKAAKDAQLLDADGKPARNGLVALVSISMSNATQEFSVFKTVADAAPADAGSRPGGTRPRITSAAPTAPTPPSSTGAPKAARAS